MNKLLLGQEDEVARCRRVRDEMDRRLKTLDVAFARLEALAKLRKRRGVRSAKARAQRKAGPAASRGEPAHRKPVANSSQRRE
jgi:hypothetical protein